MIVYAIREPELYFRFHPDHHYYSMQMKHKSCRRFRARSRELLILSSSN
jgi:hypothetical protein